MSISTGSLAIQGMKTLSSPMTTLHFTTIKMENKQVKVEFLPSLGGRIYSFKDKQLQKELLYRAPTMELTQDQYSQPWFPGGISFKLGAAQDTYGIISPVFFSCHSNHKQSDFLRMYNYDRRLGFCWQIDYMLLPEAPMMQVTVSLYNTDMQHTTPHFSIHAALPSKYMTCSDTTIYSHTTLSLLASLESVGLCTRSNTNIHHRIQGSEANYGQLILNCDNQAHQTRPEHASTQSYTLTLSCFHGEPISTMDFPLKKLEPSLPCDKLLHLGTGDGALENMIRTLQGVSLLPEHLSFPIESLTEEEFQQLSLLSSGLTI